MSGLFEHILDPARLSTVEESRLANVEPEDPFDRLTELAVAVTGAPFGFLTVVDHESSWAKSAVGQPESWPRTLPISATFCQYVVGTSAPLVVEDALTDDRVLHNPAVRSLGVRAWAGFPFLAWDLHCLGTMCLVDLEPRSWTDVDLQLLATLTQAAGTEIALRRAQQELAGYRDRVADPGAPQLQPLVAPQLGQA
ncbi:MAG: GAF domain-containing protein [Acidimicrobiales bacterium]